MPGAKRADGHLMRRINFYIGRTLFGTCAMAIAVLSFVMVSANLVRAFDLVARGIAAGAILRFILYLLPYTLQFTIPLALSCATVLVFSRLSADREITAMRASGVSLWQIISPGIILAVLLSGVCFYLQTGLAPECRYRAHLLRSAESVTNPIAFLEPGRSLEFPGHIIYVGDREGSRLRDVELYILDDDGQVRQEIRADTAMVSIAEDSHVIHLHLRDVTMVQLQRDGSGGLSNLYHSAASDTTHAIEYGSRFADRRLARRPKHMDMKTILGTIYIYNRRGEPTGPLYLELHKRMSLAFSPIGFLLLGIPLGIQTKRSETSVGLVVSLLLALFFYIFLAVADSFEGHDRFHPEILVWLPNILYQLGGLAGLHYIMKR